MAPDLRGLPYRGLADFTRNQSYNVDSPNEMVVDADDYVGVTDASEKDPVAIISPDSVEHGETDQQLQDLPMANDRMSSLSPSTPLYRLTRGP